MRGWIGWCLVGAAMGTDWNSVAKPYDGTLSMALADRRLTESLYHAEGYNVFDPPPPPPSGLLAVHGRLIQADRAQGKTWSHKIKQRPKQQPLHFFKDNDSHPQELAATPQASEKLSGGTARRLGRIENTLHTLNKLESSIKEAAHQLHAKKASRGGVSGGCGTAKGPCCDIKCSQANTVSVCMSKCSGIKTCNTISFCPRGNKCTPTNGCCLHHCSSAKKGLDVDGGWKGWDWYALTHPGIVDDEYSMASVDGRNVGVREADHIADDAANRAYKRIVPARWADRATLHKVKDLPPSKAGSSKRASKRLSHATFEVSSTARLRNFTWPPLPKMPKHTKRIHIPSVRRRRGHDAGCGDCHRCPSGSHYAGHNRCCPTCFSLNVTDPKQRCYKHAHAKCKAQLKVEKESSVVSQFKKMRRHINNEVRHLRRKLKGS